MASIFIVPREGYPGVYGAWATLEEAKRWVETAKGLGHVPHIVEYRGKQEISRHVLRANGRWEVLGQHLGGMMAKKSMTYGVMPSWAEFIKRYDDVMEGDYYRLHLRGSDARTVSAYGLDTEAKLTARDTWDYINVLATGFNEDGDDNAGDIASSMLLTLGFEWI